MTAPAAKFITEGTVRVNYTIEGDTGQMTEHECEAKHDKADEMIARVLNTRGVIHMRVTMVVFNGCPSRFRSILED